MTTGPTILVLVTVAYLVIAIDYWRHGNPFDAVVFSGYVLANCGFIWRMLA